MTEHYMPQPLFCIRLTLPDGEYLTRNFYKPEQVIREFHTPPEWIVNPRRAWPSPQDPITISGIVAEGHEDEARDWVFQDAGTSTPED